MDWQRIGRRTAFWVLASALGLVSWQMFGDSIVKVRAQSGPVITHTALKCITSEQFPQATAVIEPGPDVRTAKLYFRSSMYPDFYYIEMQRDELSEDDFLCVLPKPTPETKQIIYYIEAVDNAFNGGRTGEYDPDVDSEEECRRKDPAAVDGRDSG